MMMMVKNIITRQLSFGLRRTDPINIITSHIPRKAGELFLVSVLDFLPFLTSGSYLGKVPLFFGQRPTKLAGTIWITKDYPNSNWCGLERKYRETVVFPKNRMKGQLRLEHGKLKKVKKNFSPKIQILVRKYIFCIGTVVFVRGAFFLGIVPPLCIGPTKSGLSISKLKPFRNKTHLAYPVTPPHCGN